MRSCLYAGQVMHHRFQPKRHRFVYKVASTLLDLDEVESGHADSKLFSTNRFNIFSWYSKDHGDRSGSPVAQQIRNLLEQQDLQEYNYRIELLCYPRVLGLVFNPLSVYYCYAKSDELGVILYEVSNTFGGRHTYFIEVQNEKRVIRQQAKKDFYVSPFMPMDADYQFRMIAPKERVAVCIRQSLDKRSLLHATFTGKREPLNDRNLLNIFFKYPLMTLKVVAGIHWEALFLWCKGVKLQPRVSATNHRITIGSPMEASRHETP